MYDAYYTSSSWKIYMTRYVIQWIISADLTYTIFRTLPLDRHEDERKPTLLGGDDPDDHLFLIPIILMTSSLWTWSWVWSLNPWRSSPSRGSIKTPDLSDGSWKAPSVNRPLMESLRPAQNYEDGQTRWSSRYTRWSRSSEISDVKRSRGPQEIFIVNCLYTLYKLA